MDKKPYPSMCTVCICASIWCSFDVPLIPFWLVIKIFTVILNTPQFCFISCGKLLCPKYVLLTMPNHFEKIKNDLAPQLWSHCQAGHDDTVKDLLSKGADANIGVGNSLPLLIAAREGHEGVVQILLQAGAHVNVVTAEGTALEEATLNGRSKVLTMLFAAGACFPEYDKQGSQLLSLALCHKFNAAALVLLQHGADPNEAAATNKELNSALMLACPGCSMEVIDALIEAGAEVNVERNQATALSIARAHRRPEVAARLLLAGAEDRAPSQAHAHTEVGEGPNGTHRDLEEEHKWFLHHSPIQECLSDTRTPIKAKGLNQNQIVFNFDKFLERIQKDQTAHSHSKYFVSESFANVKVGSESFVYCERSLVRCRGEMTAIYRLYVRSPHSDFDGPGLVINDDIEACMICYKSTTALLRHCQSCGALVCERCSPGAAEIEQCRHLGPQRVCGLCCGGQAVVPALDQHVPPLT